MISMILPASAIMYASGARTTPTDDNSDGALDSDFSESNDGSDSGSTDDSGGSSDSDSTDNSVASDSGSTDNK